MQGKCGKMKTFAEPAVAADQSENRLGQKANTG